ncbi:DUF58 domain-containing protein [Acinetobacter haemolyticus]|uniref:Uncharacterized protein n=1 Tax=Acinetobacter haemolyticus CIP 64.3 = MTCC 9819 TaxID=1217659 RepID=N9EZB7_ACIHA|nr:DUF58 domain-containing protein [Acinetobacter haemolyticus]ENW15597.1 hypothetical protein F927_03336 [Acinetobacter haemolyticus CIP 64.3 = MTCC 9819]QXZ26490.1 DUF58 domain-containing protein [Acinetobacter haemolyticus]SPT48680.1 Uncharacterized conserved protein (some members contain a von Willebrand factor type A (vWA) domain) [Acinetobacter haemolyticus]SUU61903.1 Uncharacterized conserved protein (some members contain a von Willebrand factor type A (vWA) domain) [Acinetobacter haemol
MQNRLKRRLQQWVSKRFQVEQSKTFLQKDVLVFIHTHGLLYIVLILITFIAGINYANNLILGLCFLMSAILCISFYLTFKQLYGLHVELITAEVGQVGQVLTLKLNFKQPTKTNRYLQIQWQQQQQLFYLNQTQQSIELAFFPQQRGIYQFDAIKIYSTYPLGLVRAWTYLNLMEKVWIAPKAYEWQKEHKNQPSAAHDRLDEFRELRAFQHGDSYQNVAWKQVARGQGFFIKMFEAQATQQYLEIDYQHIPAQSHEEKLSFMMGLIEQCEQYGDDYAVILPHVRLDRGQGNTQLIQAKRLLAQA